MVVRKISIKHYLHTSIVLKPNINKNLCAPQMPNSPCHQVLSRSYCQPAIAMPTMHSTPLMGRFKSKIYIWPRNLLWTKIYRDLISNWFVKHPYPVGLNKCQTETFLHHQCKLTTSFLLHMLACHIDHHIHKVSTIDVARARTTIQNVILHSQRQRAN